MNYNQLFIEKNPPNPLPQLELYEYLQKAHTGDKQARDIIIIHNIRYVIYLVTHQFYNSYDQEELIAVGIIGLIKSVDTYDISKNFKFLTYASTCIKNEILMFIRQRNKYINDESLNQIEVINKKKEQQTREEFLIDKNIDFILDYENKEIYDALLEIVNQLPDKERKAIILSFGFIDDKQYSQEEIAQMLNVSQSYICRLIKKAVKTIGIKLKKQGIIESISINSATMLESKNEKRYRKIKEAKCS